MATVEEALKLARSQGPKARAAIDALATQRRVVAEELLQAPDAEEALTARLNEVSPLALSGFPWDPAAEDYALAQAVAAAWPVPRALMAAMALAPAHHWPSPPRLAQVPEWLRTVYAGHLVTQPPLFLHHGEADRYAAHGVKAMAALSAAIFEDRLPDAPALAAAVRGANASMMYFNELRLRPYFRDRAHILEWLLLKQGRQLGWTFPRRTGDGGKIGILSRSLEPGTETFFLLAHLEGRERRHPVVLYLLDAKPTSLSAAFAPWIDDIVQLPSDPGAAVARIRQDELDVCLINNNITWAFPPETQISLHRLARVQITTGGSPVTTGVSSADLFISSERNDPAPDAADDYEEQIVRIPGGGGYFAFRHDREPQTITISRAELGAAEGALVFFSSANYYKITPEILTAWAEILARAPTAILVLMPYNPNWGDDYAVALFVRRLQRTLVRHGVGDRVRIVERVPARADLHAIMALADVYLDSHPLPGACSLVDPMLVGLPIVARDGRKFRTALAAAMLETEGLESLVCADATAYVERAVRLFEDPAFREAEAARVRAAAQSGLKCLDGAGYAASVMGLCADAIDALTLDAKRMLGMDAEALRKLALTAAGEALVDPPPALRRLLDLDIVTQLLVPYVRTLAAAGGAHGRTLDVGACVGALSTPFLEAGFAVDMFDADPGCAAPLKAVEQRFPGRARLHALAVVHAPAASVTFNKRERGLSGLGESPLGGAGEPITVRAITLDAFLAGRPGVDVIKIDAEGSDLDLVLSIDVGASAPKVVMLEYGVEFPRQSPQAIGAAIRTMGERGYAAVVFEYCKLPGFAVANWDYELVGVAFDAYDLGKRGDGFGSILFYREDDRTFLAVLAQMFSLYRPARRRPIAALAAPADRALTAGA
ncbi:MAG TPA: FkbM family methyltransferase [Caulobacteraceae bacterium]|nr:FkbM family methyltransferase [Caulobacteraceae bacterium]